MTTLGALCLIVAAGLVGGWLLDLIRRGRLYVGYGIVLLALIVIVVVVSVLPFTRGLTSDLLDSLYPKEPVAVIGLAAVLLLLIYLLHQLSVLSERVATLTQELAIRGAADARRENDKIPDPGGTGRSSGPVDNQNPRE
jgi:hypothetical protein